MKRLRQVVEDPDLAVALLLGVWGAWLGWVLTGPALLSAINWDQGAYIAWACAPGGHWSDPPWNAHFAIGHVYQLGTYVTKAFGGTIVDGFRLMDALAFGVAAGFMADAARRLSGNRWLGALLSLAWATTWVNLLFLLTLEDNVLYLPGAAALFWLIVARRERWTARESVWAGVLAGWAALQSWQALYYLGPAGYAALWLSPRREKLRGGVIVTGAFFATLIGWCVIIAATSKLRLVDLLHNMFSRPTGSFSLSTPSLAFWGRILGLGFGWLATHTFVIAPPVKIPIERIGYAVMIVVTAVLIACTLIARKRGRWELHIIALSLFLFTLVTPLYHDLTEFRYIVRFDFWPLLLTLLGAAVLGALAPRPRLRAATAALVVALVVWNARAAVAWDDEARRIHPSLDTWTRLPHPGVAFYGRDGMPWFQFFRGVHEVAPHACRYIFALGEVNEGWWNPDVTGSLWSELHAPVFLVGDPSKMGRSRYFQPPILKPQTLLQRKLIEPCAWVSRDASRTMGWRY